LSELYEKIDSKWRRSATTEEDYEGALASLIRIQDIHGIDASSLARGNLLANRGVNTESPMISAGFKSNPRIFKAEDCRNLAIMSMNEGRYNIARDWIKLGKKMVKLDFTKMKEFRHLDGFAKAGIKVMTTVGNV